MFQRLTLLFALLTLFAMGLGGTALAAAPVATETYAHALIQIHGRKVHEAVINKVTHDVKLILNDGSSQLVIYPAADERTLSRSLRSHGAIVKFPRHVVKHAAAKPAHHIRYIAGGVLLVVIVVGGILFIVTSRQGEAGTTPPSPAPAPPAVPESDADTAPDSEKP